MMLQERILRPLSVGFGRFGALPAHTADDVLISDIPRKPTLTILP